MTRPRNKFCHWSWTPNWWIGKNGGVGFSGFFIGAFVVFLFPALYELLDYIKRAWIVQWLSSFFLFIVSICSMSLGRTCGKLFHEGKRTPLNSTPPSLALYTGAKIPTIGKYLAETVDSILVYWYVTGLGTWLSKPDEVRKAVLCALQNGTVRQPFTCKRPIYHKQQATDILTAHMYTATNTKWVKRSRKLVYLAKKSLLHPRWDIEGVLSKVVYWSFLCYSSGTHTTVLNTSRLLSRRLWRLWVLSTWTCTWSTGPSALR